MKEQFADQTQENIFLKKLRQMDKVPLNIERKKKKQS